MKLDKKKQHEKPNKKNPEQLTKYVIEDLMGINMPVYERRRGAIRRKY
ncbi:hypothetical protein [Heyndrickxia ginsengihumi]